MLGQFNNFKYKPVPLKHPECGPKCTGTLEGFGFQTACKRTYEPFDVASSPNGTIVFATDVDFEESTSDASIMYVNSLWKGTGQCDGVLGVDTCTLSAGMLKPHPSANHPLTDWKVSCHIRSFMRQITLCSWPVIRRRRMCFSEGSLWLLRGLAKPLRLVESRLP